MARLVVLSFKDNADAERFVEQTVGARAGLLERNGPDDEYAQRQPEVVGLFPKPTLFCDNSDGHRGGRKTQSGWTRGKKYGWWVCGICHKPSKLWGKSLGSVVSQSRNMLPDLLGEPGVPPGMLREKDVQ